ncbi:TetR/AcrR family transcriptional regulator [Gordonia sp. VNK21]|uniref:TetR/AcrR family transcriptional regulator n=1 Tax=Gordonia sp. VNK21 TaxID=3382483 RepID=UPI0038D43777
MTSELTTHGQPRRRMSKQARREQLLDTAEELFILRGYAGVTMEDICQAAGVSRPVLYGHFPTREDAYLACVQRARAAYNARMVGVADPTDSLEDQLRAGGEIFFGMLETDPGRWKLIFGNSGAMPESHAAQLADLRFETIDMIEALLHRALPDVDGLTVKTAAHAISGVGERLGLMWLREPQLSRDDIVDQYVAILLPGARMLGDSAHGRD